MHGASSLAGAGEAASRDIAHAPAGLRRMLGRLMVARELGPRLGNVGEQLQLERMLAGHAPLRDAVLATARWRMNGQLPVYELGAILGEQVLALEKGPAQQGVEEAFGYAVATAIGAQHTLATVGEREGGTVFVHVVPGGYALDAGVRNAATLEGSLARAYAGRGAGTEEAALRARWDRQLLGALDYLLGNMDRSPSNLLVDATTGFVTGIDQGSLGLGAMRGNGALHPILHPLVQGGAVDGTLRRVTLDPEVVATIAGADRAAIRAAYQRLMAAPESSSEMLANTRRFVRSDQFIDGLQQRLDHLVATGGYSYSPIRNGAVFSGLESMVPR